MFLRNVGSIKSHTAPHSRRRIFFLDNNVSETAYISSSGGGGRPSVQALLAACSLPKCKMLQLKRLTRFVRIVFLKDLTIFTATKIHTTAFWVMTVCSVVSLCCLSDQSSWMLTQRSRGRLPALPDFLNSSGSGTGSTQPL
jgi:hypothetical protein